MTLCCSCQGQRQPGASSSGGSSSTMEVGAVVGRTVGRRWICLMKSGSDSSSKSRPHLHHHLKAVQQQLLVLVHPRHLRRPRLLQQCLVIRHY